MVSLGPNELICDMELYGPLETAVFKTQKFSSKKIDLELSGAFRCLDILIASTYGIAISLHMKPFIMEKKP